MRDAVADGRAEPRAGRPIAGIGLALAVGALAIVLLRSPGGLAQSSDVPDLTPIWQLLLAPIAAIVLIRLLPPSTPDLTPRVENGRRLGVSLAVLVACAVAFPVLVGALGIGGSEWYVVLKAVVLIAVPGLVVLATRRATSFERPSGAWRWWAPTVVALVWFALSSLAPWVVHPDLSAIPRDLLVTAAIATAVTASVGEELFYRRWLQTRVEALLGRWGGITVSTVLFAAMHVGTRQGGDPLLEVAGAILVQGVFGVVVGYLWSKYRNIWIPIAVHLLANGFAVVLELLS